MAESPGPSGPDLFTQQSMNKQAGGDQNAPPEDLFDFFTKLFEKIGDWVTKATGVNVGSFFNTGADANVRFNQAGLRVHNPIITTPNGKGGPVYNALAAPFIKNGAITDLTQGVGGNAFGGEGGHHGGSGGEGGGGEGGGGHHGSGDSPMHAFSSIAAQSHQLEWGPASEALLGNYSPSDTPRVGPSSGAGMDVG